MKKHKKNVIIIGGGAGGLELAAKLVKNKNYQVTLVDNTLTHIWKPLLHEVAAGSLNSDEDQLNYFDFANKHHFLFEYGNFSELDRKNKKIYLDPIYDDDGNVLTQKRYLNYDYLVIAVGSVANDFGIPGVKEHCYFLENQMQAEDFHRRLLTSWFAAYHQPHHEINLDIAIVGGGATGVELAAELHHMSLQLKKMFSNSESKNIKTNIHIIESGSRLLSQLPEYLSEKIHRRFKAKKIHIHTNDVVTEVVQGKLKTKNGEEISAGFIVWTAGIKAPDFLKNLDGIEVNTRNQIIIKPTLQSTQDDCIFAIGDCAFLAIDEKQFVPARAQAAHQQAMLLTKTFKNITENKPLPEYRYNDYGSLVSISNQAFGVLMGKFTGKLPVEGKLAHWLYISLYRKHILALHGFWRTTLLTGANILTRHVKPRLKLH